MSKSEIIDKCRKAISDDLGTLKDLPYELANTVANIYYRWFNFASYVIQNSKPGWIPTNINGETGLVDNLMSFSEKLARYQSEYENIPGLIHDLRNIKRDQQPNLYAYAVEFILDDLKYKIKNAHKKTGLRRLIERKFMQNRIEEIPNLLDQINI